MRKTLALIALVPLLAIAAHSQTLRQYDYLRPSVMEYQVQIPTNAPGAGFFGTLVQWTTTFDPDNTMFKTNDILELNSGLVNNANQNMEAFLGLRVNPWGVNGGFALGGTLYNNSALGQITGAEGWVGYSLTHADFRITGEIAAGAHADQLGNKVGQVSPKIVAEKATSETTAAYIALKAPILLKGPQNMSPDVEAGVTAKLW